MKVKKHFIIASITIFAWFVFYLIGLPSDYFLEWNMAEQNLLSLITFFAIVPIIFFVTIVLLIQNYLRTGTWLAFYASMAFNFQLYSLRYHSKKWISLFYTTLVSFNWIRVYLDNRSCDWIYFRNI